MSEDVANNSKIVRKSKMTDEERLALCTKMDQELEDFIDGLEKKRYTEGWPEDRWEEEMDKHPFFMKSPPKPGDELHPLLEGMQQLKYDPMENTLEDVAIAYKDDGNFNMKYKKYRMAIFSYTEGIHQKCENAEVNASLYNNRSAANYFLKNYRSSIDDAKKALAIKSDYEKAELRLAQCLFHMKKYQDCLNACTEYETKYGSTEKINELRKNARENHLKQLRDERKREVELKKLGEVVTRTVNELTKRGIKFEEQTDKTRIQDILRPIYAPLEDFPIHIDQLGVGLVWPACFCYPEFEYCDFQQELEDNIVMYDILVDLFAERMEFDVHYAYRPNNVNVYFENKLTAKVHLVNVQDVIKTITANKNFVVSKGVLLFYVLVKNSNAEKEFLLKSRVPLFVTRSPFDP